MLIFGLIIVKSEGIFIFIPFLNAEQIPTIVIVNNKREKMKKPHKKCGQCIRP